ncbi:MAG: ParB/RepB/Spo0J family partition protein [Bacteroidota bacterium]
MAIGGKTVLGRGLASLIPREPPPSAPLQGRQDDGQSLDVVVMVDVERVERNPYQPRMEFDPEALRELKESILEKGIIQPITVRRTDRGYQLISGERRVRAAREAGMMQVPAYIIRVKNNEEMLELALIENLQREDLNPIEIASSYRRLIEECGLTQELVSKKVGKDRSTVTNFLRLLKLPDAIQAAVRKGELSGGHARALLGIENPELQMRLFKRILSRGLSVRAIETLVRSAGQVVKQAGKGRASAQASSGMANLEDKLRQLLGTKVMIRPGQNGRGEIVIEYYTADDLDRLLDLFSEFNPS